LTGTVAWGEGGTNPPSPILSQNSFVLSPDFMLSMFQDGSQTNKVIHLSDLTGK